tara:strand:+ start:11186 stop:11587 length:402 start_codon:yes stop_codon:yes gene_type:complete
MKSLKQNIRRVLKERINVSYRIATKELDKEVMNKRLFIEVITQLKEIEDRKDFLADEIGLDMTAYEDQFFAVIENLFRFTFNKEQVALIKMYLYQLMPDSDWDGTIVLEVGKKEATVAFKTPAEVWNVVKNIK